VQFSADLKNKVELWGMTDNKNILGETERTAGKLKDLWCKVTPKTGKVNKMGNTDVEEIEFSAVIRCRKLSIKEPSIDMFFMKNGIKYEVVYFLEDMKNNSFLEFLCKIIYE